MRTPRFALTFAAFIASPSNLYAADWDVTQFEDSCGVFQSFEGKGETALALILFADGRVGLTLRNSGWSANAGRKYDIIYQIDDTSFSGAPSIGLNDIGEKVGFLSLFSDEFVSALANGDSLKVTMGEVIVDQLSLKGSAAGIARARNCLRDVNAEMRKSETERQKLAHIADDPFKEKSAKISDESFQNGRIKLVGNQPPIPKGHEWANISDYPIRALQEKREGAASFKLTVGINGVATNCEIVKSSGHIDLDDATCKNISKRARFNSATDENGKPIVGTYSSSLRWQIPEP